MPPNMQKNKEWVVPLICIVIVVAIVVIGQRTTKKTEPVVPAPGETPTVTEWPSHQTKMEKIADQTKQYEITAYYPVTPDGSITGIFRDFVNGEIDTFKQNLADAGELPEGYPAATLDISYEEEQHARADNYIFTISTDSGGAHGLSTTKTFSFTKAGTRIALADLFTNGTQGLGTIADYVQADLKKREFADPKLISEGAAPIETNYQNFVVKDNGLMIIFDPYQVAAYAAGTQTVTVPTSVFKRIANPELF